MTGWTYKLEGLKPEFYGSLLNKCDYVDPFNLLFGITVLRTSPYPSTTTFDNTKQHEKNYRRSTICIMW